MVYILPQPYKCPKCGYECNYGPHENWQYSPITSEGKPVCPKCWNQFLQANVPSMEPEGEGRKP